MPPGMDRDHVVLIAVVDADVWIHRPNEHRIDAAVTLSKVIEIAVDRIFARTGSYK